MSNVEYICDKCGYRSHIPFTVCPKCSSDEIEIDRESDDDWTNDESEDSDEFQSEE